jgi:acetyl-CoA acetyltransferase family protein
MTPLADADIVLSLGRRSPLGRFGGGLRDVPLTDLSAQAARASVAAAGLGLGQVDHFVFATTIPTDRDSLFAHRAICVATGFPVETSALGVVRACGSGLQAIVSAAHQVLDGSSRIALAGGAEIFSRVPYVITTARWGHKRGTQQLEDMLDWAYRCPTTLLYMGETAEKLAALHDYRREAMDDWALMSQARAIAAQDSGFLAAQICPIELPAGGRAQDAGPARLELDESPRRGITREKLGALKPAFAADGRVTAGNASPVSDGAGFMVVADRAALREAGGTPHARLLGWATVGVPPELMGHGPVPAIGKLLARHGLGVADIDYWEINEAFAAVTLHTEAQLGIDRARTNLYGGAISIGHPPGVTGVRMTHTAIQHLTARGGGRAVMAMCLGSGQGMAMLIESCDH